MAGITKSLQGLQNVAFFLTGYRISREIVPIEAKKNKLPSRIILPGREFIYSNATE
jgi:hypothetical protein